MDGNGTGFVPGSGSTVEKDMGGWFGKKDLGTTHRDIKSTGLDVKMFDTSQLDTMKRAVSTYKAGVDEIIAKIQSPAQNTYSLGFFGEAQVTKVMEYVALSVAEIQKVTSYFDEFIAALDTVGGSYSSQAGSIGIGEVTKGSIDGELTGVDGFSGSSTGGTPT